MDTLFKEDGMMFWQMFWKDYGRKDETVSFSDMILCPTAFNRVGLA